VKSAEGNRGKIKEPIIVVSDVHLGGKGSNDDDFREFLDWLNTLPVDGTSFKCEDTELTIKHPGTLVLLGDILELWDPEEDDRNHVMTDVLAPISILNNLDCDIIYVIGNHDEDLLDFKSVWRKEKVEFPFKGTGTFDIVYRSYPRKNARTNIIEGKLIGKNKYAFLHGQQFDRFQVFYRISKFLSTKLKKQVRIDPIDWFQDLANVSFTRNVGKKQWDTFIFGLLFVLYGLVYYWRSDIPIGSGFGILWVIISFFFVVTILPKVVTWSSTKIWGWVLRTKKCSSVEEVIEDRYNEDKGRNIDASIVVFGHTHNAGTYYKEDEKRLFINTGCWVSECAEKKRNTFLYIDAEAPYLLTWDKEKVDNGKITCLEDLSAVVKH
jgi:UDP-2,3-diacylglucosamine pyrophosphatase LpxH